MLFNRQIKDMAESSMFCMGCPGFHRVYWAILCLIGAFVFIL